MEIAAMVTQNVKNSTSISAAIERQIVLVPISDLKPHPGNARKHSQAQIKAIAKSIETFGFNAPALVDKDGNILAGHGRVEAGTLLGLSHIPVVFLHHLTDAEAKAYMIADNKLTDRSGWDDDMLAVQLKELSELALSFDIDATGFELPEIDFLIQSLEQTEPLDRADNFQISGGQPVSVLGDVWHLGYHKLLCGRSRSGRYF